MTDRFYFRQLLSGLDFALDDPVAEQMVNFVYAIGDRETGEAVLVDPAYRPAELIDLVEADGMRVGARHRDALPRRPRGREPRRPRPDRRHRRAARAGRRPDPRAGRRGGVDHQAHGSRRGLARRPRRRRRGRGRRRRGLADPHAGSHAGQPVSVGERPPHQWRHAVPRRLRPHRPARARTPQRCTARSPSDSRTSPTTPCSFPGHLYSADPSAPMGEVRRHNRAFVPASADQWLAMFASLNVLQPTDHVVIVGAGFGGLATGRGAAARRLRRRDHARRRRDPPALRPPAALQAGPRRASGTSSARRSPRPSDWRRADATLRLGVRATGLDIEANTVTLEDGSRVDGTHIVLATGTRARDSRSAPTTRSSRCATATTNTRLRHELERSGRGQRRRRDRRGIHRRRGRDPAEGSRDSCPIVLEATPRPLIGVVGPEVSSWLERLARRRRHRTAQRPADPRRRARRRRVRRPLRRRRRTSRRARRRRRRGAAELRVARGIRADARQRGGRRRRTSWRASTSPRSATWRDSAGPT